MQVFIQTKQKPGLTRLLYNTVLYTAIYGGSTKNVHDLLNSMKTACCKVLRAKTVVLQIILETVK